LDGKSEEQFMNKHLTENKRLGVMSIQTKIILWSGISFFLSAAFVIGYAAFALRNIAIRSAESRALDIAHTQAAEIQTVLERTLSSGETFTQSVIVGKTEGVPLSREQVNAMLRQVLKNNPQYVGVDVLFEPNAFDGKDAIFANTTGSDANGRFLPYWTRGEGGKIQVELLQDYDVSDWYQCPKTTKVPCLIDPYVYPVQGQDVWMTSLVIPFVYEDTFLGITGIDTPVTFLQELADQVDIFNREGEVIIISNNGTLLGVTGRPELVGQPVTAVHDHFSTEDYQAIGEGQELLRYALEGEGQLEVFVPIRVGDTANPWSVNVIVPRAAILAEASSQMGRMIAIGSGLLVVSLVALFYVARQIAQPIQKITDVALQVAGGNLNVVAEVQSTDETGILANAFNQMTEQLRTLFGTLEQRVTDRTKALATVAEVSAATATILESQRLLQEVVDLTKERFDLYHSHIYLLDEKGENLVLRAGAGEPGRVMVSEGHAIPVSSERSLVTRAARERRGVTVNDVTQAPDFLPNPLLPDTRSELAVPMIVAGNVIGVFDIQSEEVGRFTDADINVQTTLAAQLAASVQNVRSFEQSQKQAQFESLVNAISQKIQRAASIEETLKVGVREVGLALGAAQVSASISRREDSSNLTGSN
jgi:GAF domain-containing protein